MCCKLLFLSKTGQSQFALFGLALTASCAFTVPVLWRKQQMLRASEVGGFCNAIVAVPAKCSIVCAVGSYG